MESASSTGILKSYEIVFANEKLFDMTRSAAAFSHEDMVGLLTNEVDDPSTISKMVFFTKNSKNLKVVSSKGNNPSFRANAKIVKYNNCLYLFGGFDYLEKDVDSIYCMSFDSLRWTIVDNSQMTPRVDHSFVNVENLLIIYGGFHTKKIFNDLRIFDLLNSCWLSLDIDPKTGPGYRFGHSANVFGSDLMIYGGKNVSTALNDMWRFSFQNCKWSRMTLKGAAPTLFRHSSELVDHNLIIYGGMSDSKTISGSFYVMDLIKMTIKQAVLPSGPTMTPRHSHKSLFILGEILIIGGHSNSSNLWEMIAVKVHESLSGMKHDQQSMVDAHSFKSFSRVHSIKNESFLDLDNFYEWRTCKPQGDVFTPRTGHAVVAVGSTGYLFGGADNQSILNDLYSFDLVEHKWARVQGQSGTPPSVRSGSKCTSRDQLIYFFGGYTKAQYFNDLHEFNTDTLIWRQVPLTGKKIQERVDHSMVIWKKYLFVFGGTNGDQKFSNTFRINSITGEVIEVKAEGMVPGERFGHSADSFQNCMWVFGGWDGLTTLNELCYFSFVTNIWYEERAMTGAKPLARYRQSSQVIGKSLFIFGGVDKQGKRFNDLYEYLFERREWRMVEVLGVSPSPRTFHQAITYDNNLYIVGGTDGKKLNDVHFLTFPDHAGMGNLMLSQEDMFGDFANSSFTSSFSFNSMLQGKSANSQIEQLQKQVQELSSKLCSEQERNLCIVQI